MERGLHGQDRHRPRLLGLVVVALVLHLLAIPLLPRVLLGQADATAAAPGKRVQLLSLAPYKKSGRQATPPPRPALPPKREEEKKPEEKLTGQVVDLPPSADSRPPEHADYLSEHNTRTERETRSRHQSKDYQNVMNEPTVARQPQDMAAPQAGKELTALEVGPEKQGKAKEQQAGGQARAFELPSVRRRDRLALNFDPKLGQLRNQGASEQLQGNSDRLRLSMGDVGAQPSEAGSAPKQGPTVLDLVPEAGVLARLSGGPSNDFLDNVEEGEGTFLNSREFKYASFFNRMKRGVSQHWRPLAEYNRRDPTGNIYGYKSRVTVLSITLNADGSLKGVEVTRSSGVDFLDREAISAFRRAEPFPNPPKGLINGSGQITFPFGFHIDFNNRAGGALPF